jgi:hypothetical protein
MEGETLTNGGENCTHFTYRSVAVGLVLVALYCILVTLFSVRLNNKLYCLSKKKTINYIAVLTGPFYRGW